MAEFVRMPKADWTDICDAVREKTETSDMLLSGTVAGMVRGISGGGGDTTLEDGLVTKTLSEYTNDRVVKLPSYSFDHWLVDLKLIFPNCTTLEKWTFFTTEKLILCDFGKKVDLPQYTFYNNKNFKTLIIRTHSLRLLQSYKCQPHTE